MLNRHSHKPAISYEAAIQAESEVEHDKNRHVILAENCIGAAMRSLKKHEVDSALGCLTRAVDEIREHRKTMELWK